MSFLFVWYEVACDNAAVARRFTNNAGETRILSRQLRLAQLFEDHGRLLEAEAIYQRALDKETDSYDNIARESLQTVK